MGGQLKRQGEGLKGTLKKEPQRMCQLRPNHKKECVIFLIFSKPPCLTNQINKICLFREKKEEGGERKGGGNRETERKREERNTHKKTLISKKKIRKKEHQINNFSLSPLQKIELIS